VLDDPEHARPGSVQEFTDFWREHLDEHDWQRAGTQAINFDELFRDRA
jgi:hypothetical protein